MPFALDHTGKTFGALTVLGRATSVPGRAPNVVGWLCRCVCGREVAVASSELTGASRRDCGCGIVPRKFKRAGHRGI